MANTKVLAVAAALGVAGGGASAQDIGFGGSVSFLSDYIASGESQTGRKPALQFTGYAYVPSGFYAGVFLSNVDFSEAVIDYYGGGFDYEDPDSLEIGVFVGWEYFTDFGLSLDIGYERYWYDDSGYCCGLFYLGVDYAINDMVEVGAYASYNHTSNNTNMRALLTVYPTDNIGLRALVGRNQGNFNLEDGGGYSSAINYWNVGVDYFFSDSVNVSLDYHDSTSPVRSSALVAGLTYSF